MNLVNPKVTAAYMRGTACEATHISEVKRITEILETVRPNKKYTSLTSVDVCSHVQEEFENRGFKVTRIERPRSTYLEPVGAPPVLEILAIFEYELTKKSEKNDVK